MAAVGEKIYFCGSIRAGREDQPIYKRMVDHMKQKYGEVLTFHVAEPGQEPDRGTGMGAIHDRDVEWMRQATRVVAEVTTPSLGVGYELGLAWAWKKPTLCLYRTAESPANRQKKLSAMIKGNPDFVNVTYTTVEEGIAAIDKFFAVNKH